MGWWRTKPFISIFFSFKGNECLIAFWKFTLHADNHFLDLISLFRYWFQESQSHYNRISSWWSLLKATVWILNQCFNCFNQACKVRTHNLCSKLNWSWLKRIGKCSIKLDWWWCNILELLSPYKATVWLSALETLSWYCTESSNRIWKSCWRTRINCRCFNF